MAEWNNEDVGETLRQAVLEELNDLLSRESIWEALRKLDIINSADDLQDLRAPPGNRLEALKGDLKGFHSIRVNEQWRIVFRWQDGVAHDIRLTDD